MDYPWRVKLRRANAHIDELEAACKAYCSEAGVGFAYDTDRHAGTIRVTLTASHGPPDALGAILGDAIQNLRAALDSIAWSACELSEDLANSPVGWNVYFPISRDSVHWSNKIDKWLPHMAAEKRETFRRLQPWFWDEQAELVLGVPQKGSSSLNHTLHHLHRLSNSDRHRGVHVVVARAGMPWITSNSDASVAPLPGDRWPVDPGGTVVTWQVTPREAVDEVVPDGSVVIALESDRSREPDSCTEQLRTMSRHVARIITQVEVAVLELVSQDELDELRALQEAVDRAEEDLDRLYRENRIVDRSLMDAYRSKRDARDVARSNHEQRSRELFG